MSKRKRFAIFKRDAFTCQYCGRKPPDVTLEVDHIIPDSKGGGSGEENLITSCFDCNRGKADIGLDVIPDSLVDVQRRQLEAYEQAEEIRRQQQEQEKQLERSVRKLQRDFGIRFSSTAKCTVVMFLRRLSHADVEEAMSLADGRFCLTNNRGWRYFCGVCWNKIRDLEGPRRG